ncbi:hypothetical protein DSECCO2_628530 [anaerobic digester metagenome]
MPGIEFLYRGHGSRVVARLRDRGREGLLRCFCVICCGRSPVCWFGSRLHNLDILLDGNVGSHLRAGLAQHDVLRQQDIAFGKGHGARDGVPEFADVSRPVVVHELVEGSSAQFGRRSPSGLGFEEMANQGRDVLLAFAQRRGGDGDDGQPVVEILPEGPVSSEFEQVNVGGGYDPGVERLVLVAAQGSDGPRGQGAQQRLLDFGRGVADFVQVEGAARCGEEGALAVALGLREGPFDVAEQGVHEQILIQRPAIDRNERPRSPDAGPVDRFGRQFLAGAGFADDKHVGHDLGGLLNHGVQVADGLAGADDAEWCSAFGRVVDVTSCLHERIEAYGLPLQLLQRLDLPDFGLLARRVQLQDEHIHRVLEMAQFLGQGRKAEDGGIFAKGQLFRCGGQGL